MEVDSGAPVSLINDATYKKLFPKFKIQNIRLKLVSYCKTRLNIIGFIHVPVTYNRFKGYLNLYIVQGDRNPLLGREWIRTLHINLGDLDDVNKISCGDDPDMQNLLSEYEEILSPETLPVTVKDLARATKADSSLGVLLDALQSGKRVDKEFTFNMDQDEFTLQSGCIMRGQRVVIPHSERKKVLEELHCSHLGIVKMKNLARSYCWWAAELTAPYHPATNGQAERYVQTLKKALRTVKFNNYNKNLELCKFLLQYRRTPHIVTKKSPSELMFGRQIRSRLDCLRPESDDNDIYNGYKKIRELEQGTRVAVRDYLYEKWKFGMINKRIGKLHYIVELDDGRKWKRHIDQIRVIGQKTPTEPYLPEHDGANNQTKNTISTRDESQNLRYLPVTLNTDPSTTTTLLPTNNEALDREPMETSNNDENETVQPDTGDAPPVMLR
nr:unnamed protein product [Callosobruchus chinensis]